MTEELKIIISAEVSKLKNSIGEAKKVISTFKTEFSKHKKDIVDGWKKIGEGVEKAAKVITGTVIGIGTALIGTSAATAEYREGMAKLTTAFEAAGGTAETAKQTYNDLYRVMGDSDTAVEAANHLAKLTTNQQALSQWTNICQGVYATFGDSLPIEGLTEAANETAKTGSLTGVLADALNWAGVSEDAFQAKLDKCNTVAKREQLIRQTLNNLYRDASARYEENNAQILAQNEANAKLQGALARLGEAVAPVITAFTNFAAQALAVVAPYVEALASKYIPVLEQALARAGEALAPIAQFIVDNLPMILKVAGTVLGIAGAIKALKVALTAYNAVKTVFITITTLATATQKAFAVANAAALAPILAVIAVIGALVAGFVLLWRKCEGFRAFWIALWNGLKQVFAGFVASVRPLINAIVDAFKMAWELIKIVWDRVKPYFEMVWNNIKAVFSVVKDVLGAFFRNAWIAIKAVWDVVAGYFTMVWNTIKGIFSVVKAILTGDFKGAWEGIKGIWNGVAGWFGTVWNSIKSIFGAVGDFFASIFSSAWNGVKSIWSNVIGFFSNIWNSIKKIFSDVGNAIAGGIKGAVSGAVNAVLSIACKIINGFISAINFAIGIINVIPGVNIKKLDKLSVPRMAKGGVVDSATLAVVGERGKEAVMPLENNLEWLDKLAGMLSARMGGGSAPIVLKVDGKAFAQIACDSINDLTRQRGSIPLVIA